MSDLIIVVDDQIVAEADDLDAAVREALAKGHDVDDLAVYRHLGSVAASYEIT